MLLFATTTVLRYRADIVKTCATIKRRDKMKKEKTKQINRQNISKIILLCVGGIGAILADYFFPRNYLPMEDLFELVFSMISVIAGIWITCYLLVLELFKDRYPFNFLKEEHLPKMKAIFILLGSSVLYGLVIALSGNRAG